MVTPPDALNYEQATRAELSVLTIKSLLIAFRMQRGQGALETALAGLPVSLDYMGDRRNWVSFSLLECVLSRLTDASGDPGFPRMAGRMTVSEEALGFTYSVMRGVGSPRLLYRYLFGNAHLYNRVGRMELVKLSDTQAEVVYVPLRAEWNDSALILEHRLGQFESMPAVFGLPAAHVRTCLEPREGVVAVRYFLNWLPQSRRVWLDWRLWGATLASAAWVWLLQHRLRVDGPPPGTLLPLLVFVGGWLLLRARREGDDATRLVALLEETLDQARIRHDELRVANMTLEKLRGALEQRVTAQDRELAERFTALQQAYADLEHLASHDGLTGLLNRRIVDERLRDLIAAHVANAQPLTVLLFDIDRFKLVNDTYGHEAGDRVLVAIARVLQARCIAPLQCGRYGGEEFLVLLPGFDLDSAKEWADGLTAVLRETRPLDSAPDYVVRVSGGLVQLAADEADVKSMVRRADALLYAAKHRGRDQILQRTRDPSRGETPPWTTQ